MPSWSEYKKKARERGDLALEQYVVNSVPAEAADKVAATLPDHLAYQARMETEGKLAFAGPVSDASGEQMEGEGLIIYRAGSLEEARGFADGDPMHATGARSYTIRRWLINEGSLTLEVGLSGGRAKLR